MSLYYALQRFKHELHSINFVINHKIIFTLYKIITQIRLKSLYLRPMFIDYHSLRLSLRNDMTTKQTISEFDLLLIANQVIQEHDNYIEGMRADSVTEKDDVLVFKGEYFLDSDGLPTPNTTAVFNMFKYLAHHLSKEFTVEK